MYTLIGTAVLTLGISVAENADTEQSLTTSIILIGLSLLFFTLSFRNWRQQPEQDQDGEQTSRFAKIVDGITPIKSLALAAAISLINFKNLTIFLSAVSILLLSDLQLATQLTMLIPLVLIFCTSVIIPVTIYWLFPDHARDYLTRIKETIGRYSRPLGITVTLILGCLFLYRGLTGLL